MAELKLTPQQQRFVFAVLNGQSQLQAYKAAGYRGGKKAEQLASLVAGGTRVREALARARADAAARAEITVDDLVSQLLATREIALACDPPQASAAVAASMGVGKLLGLVIDRSELNVTRNRPSPIPTKALELDETEWRRLFDPSHVSHNDR